MLPHWNPFHPRDSREGYPVTPMCQFLSVELLVIPSGFEPETHRLKGDCSNQLRYEIIVILSGLEPESFAS